MAALSASNGGATGTPGRCHDRAISREGGTGADHPHRPGPALLPGAGAAGRGSAGVGVAGLPDCLGGL